MTINLTSKQKIKILNSSDIFKIMQEVLLREEKIDQEKEHFWMIGLAQNNKVQYLELVSLGSVNATILEPMNVFRFAVMKGSVKVLLVHNHPSGELTPSQADKDITDRLIQVGRILNIKVIDHLILSLEDYYSFASEGLLQQLELSTAWVPQFELIQRIKKEEEKIREEMIRTAEKKSLQKGKKEGKKEGKIEKAIEMAKEMLNDGVSMEKVVKYTRLTKKEVEQLKEDVQQDN